MSFRKPLVAAAVLALTMGLSVVPVQAAETLPFRDPTLPLSRRIDDLLGRLTLAEKISWLHQYQPAVDRLGIGLFKTGTEALHGVAWSTDIDDGGKVVTAQGTVFPQAVGLASTWDPDLVEQVGAAVGTEARGYHAENPRTWGLQLWAPVVNLLRDPRWGRNEEGYSEDPLLTGAISTAYGTGIQGDDPDHLRAAPVLKHFLANNNEVHRDTTSSSLRPRVLNEYDVPAFRTAIAADAATGVMTAYNRINGRPATVTDLDSTVRTWTDRPVFNVTDAGGPGNLTGSQAYYATQAEAAAATIKAGVASFTANDTNAAPTVDSVNAALAQGLLTTADIDGAVRDILGIRFRLGEFDPDGGPYGKITKAVVDSPEHRALNRRTAAEAMVLLKNADKALPLSPAKKVAVVGPLADTLYTDWYSGKPTYRVTPLDGIRERAATTAAEGVDRIALKAGGRYLTAGTGAGADLKLSATTAGPTEQFDVFDWGQGVVTLRSAANGKYVSRANWSTLANSQDQPTGWFVQEQFKLEAQSDGTTLLRYAGYETAYDWFGPDQYVTAAADGTLGLTTAEGATRFTRETVRSGVDEAVAAAKDADVAVVVVGSMPFINGREDHDRTGTGLAEGQQALVEAVRKANPNTVVVLENSYPTTVDRLQDKIPAILWTTHAGAETGHALADILYGDANPAGRLTQTWPRAGTELPDILDYDIIKTGATYLYAKERPLYAFGHGLSYTTFGYQGLRVTSVPDGYEVSVRVTNTGSRAGDEVVQLYTHQHSSRVEQPVRQLRGFQRVHLAPGESKVVKLPIKTADLALWDVTRGRFTVEPSVHDVLVGSSSDRIRWRTTVKVSGERIPARDLTRVTRAADFDDYAGVELVDETKVSGDAVGASAGEWVAFRDVDLGTGIAGVKLGVAAVAASSVEVRLGSPAGKLLGTVPVAATGGIYQWATATAPLAGARGKGDLYLVVKGDLRIRDLTLTR
ncbi:glycoside hydrolase family 3 protein [Streptosporangium sp. NBC_01756]|uniref:glycoside hydrolase family 3 protein n=1 Tax=Streptosporangium sp. NBC_01756 TaxID=2975950 RepID=UPI002DD8FBF4|nr:glycoside hydrolase family 3 C-terminal domain-containing protein [Streptosporangium sp. NBC_01756]WSC83689.1 glycoside hydrolase family 3 C-terminal domain-containing protein [Streptosporangium sp. NBC_01756]